MLYLIRHADAIDSSPDEARPLSPKGHGQAARIGAAVRSRQTPAPDEIWESPLVRAKETTDILCKRIGWTAPRRELAELEPEADPLAIATRIERWAGSAAVVGHNPHLTMLSTLLVTGRFDCPLFAVGKCDIIAFEPTRGRRLGDWTVLWRMTPDSVR